MDDYSEFFKVYSQRTMVIAYEAHDNREVVDRSRCAVCQVPFKTTPRHEVGDTQFSWCISCEASLVRAVEGENQFYTMRDVISHAELGKFLGFSGYCDIIRRARLSPASVETDHPKEPEMQERWYKINIKAGKGK